MKKRVKGREFSLKSAQRKALILSVARALFRKEKIQTTVAKAKEVSSFAEKCITKAKKGGLHNHQQLLRYFESSLVTKMMKDIAPRYTERRGGYTRVIKLGPRKSDG